MHNNHHSIDPPPRPPVICYNLRTNTNPRPSLYSSNRVPSVGATRKPKVTVVEREPPATVRRPVHREPTEFTRTRLRRSRDQHDYLAQAQPYEFNTHPFEQETQPKESRFNSVDTRHAYGQKLRLEAEERELRLAHRRQQLAIAAQLEEADARLGSVRRVHEDLLRTYGIGHQTAKYIQKLDEDNAQLRCKIDMCSQTRSRELERRAQQMKKLQELQQIEDMKIEQKRLENMKRPNYRKPSFSSLSNGSLSSESPTTNSASNTASASSTISFSSYSSSSDEPEKSTHSVESPPKRTNSRSHVSIAPRLSSSTPRRNTSIKNTPIKDFSFYKRNPESEETLEVTDIDFFEKVEDKTMLEVNNMYHKMQSVLKDLNLRLN